MYVVYELIPDGDSITLFNDLSEAKDAFDEASSGNSDSEQVVLAEVILGKSFGFGAMGDFYGGEIIFEHYPEGDSESPLCGACGGDATICDGC